MESPFCIICPPNMYPEIIPSRVSTNKIAISDIENGCLTG